VALMYGLSLLPAKGGLGFVAGGFIGISIFIAWEAKTESPVYDLNLFKTNRVFAFSNVAALINYSATFAVAFLLSLYLQHIKGLSPQNAGIILVAQPIVQTLFSPLAGRLSDRIEPRIVATTGMSLTALGLVFFIFLDEHSTLVLIVAWLILLGFGFALFSSPNTNAIMGSVERRFYGLASGSVGTMRLLGMMISMGITTMLFSMLIGRVQITAEYYPAFLKSIRVAFIVFSLLCFGGIFASMVRGRTGSYPSGKGVREHGKVPS
jgi:MFS family permease